MPTSFHRRPSVSSHGRSVSNDGVLEAPAHLELPRWQRRRVFFVVCIQEFLAQLGFAVMAPLFPQEASDRDVESSVVGWVFGIFQLVIVIGSPLALRLIPEVGPTRLLKICNFVDGSANIAFALTWYAVDTNRFIMLCFATRIVAASACGITMVVGCGLLPYLFTGKLSTGSAIIETVIGVALTFGPVMGSFLYTLGGEAKRMGYVLPYLTLGVVQFVFGIFACMYYPVLPTPDAKQAGIRHFSAKAVLPCSVCLFSSAAIEFASPTLQPYLAEAPYEFSIAGVGTVFAVWSFIYVGVSPLVGIADDKTDGRYAVIMMVFGTLCMSLGYIVLAPAGFVLDLVPLRKSIPNMWIGICLVGGGAGFSLIPTYNNMFQYALHADEESQANATSALYNVMYAAGAFLGPTVAGELVEIFGYGESYMLLAVFLMVIAVLLIIVARFQEPRFARSAEFHQGSVRSSLSLSSPGTEEQLSQNHSRQEPRETEL
mmetsp:Transcript_3305/g.6025  ORF Transcript_3305/g.6025 Transcript_3305/m.6025 type:complete len:486 (+) Transcript_3305:115-1572(+)